MPNASKFARSAVIAVTVMSIGASPAMARPADHPAHYKPAITTVAQQTRPWTRPRVEGTGVRPVDRPAAPAVPLTRAADSSGGADWLLITLAALTLLTLLMIGGVIRHHWHRTDSFHARQV